MKAQSHAERSAIPSCLAQGINALVKLLQPSKDTKGSQLAETVAVAITILSINNELNQDAVRSDSSPVNMH